MILESSMPAKSTVSARTTPTTRSNARCIGSGKRQGGVFESFSRTLKGHLRLVITADGVLPTPVESKPGKLKSTEREAAAS
jgi:hypothetical protein